MVSPLQRQDAFKLTPNQNEILSAEIAAVIHQPSPPPPAAAPAAAPAPPPPPQHKPEIDYSRSNGSLNGSGSQHNGNGSKSERLMVNGGKKFPPPRGRSRDNSPIPPTFSRTKQPAKAASVSSENSETTLSKDELKSVQLRNQNMRQIIYKEVKRPGKNHQKLMEMLRNDLRGPPSVRRAYIKEVISEADRFKRRSLAQLLENQMEQLVVPAPTTSSVQAAS